MDRFLFIVNPISGSGRGEIALDTAGKVLARAGNVDTVLTGARGDAEMAAKTAAEAGYQTVVVAGGDGTINEVVNGLAGSETRCGIIPVGTANVLARELGIPINDPKAAAEIVLSGTAKDIDLGLAGSRYFAAMAGFGFDAAVVQRVEPKIKDLIGPGAYFIAIAEELLHQRPSNYRIETDDQVIDTEAFLVIVSNTAAYAYGIAVAPKASVDSGRLEVIVFEKAEPARIGLLHQAARVLMQTHLDDQNVRSFSCRKLTITAEPSVLMQVDGDPAGCTPAIVQVVPLGLSVIVGGGALMHSDAI